PQPPSGFCVSRRNLKQSCAASEFSISEAIGEKLMEQSSQVQRSNCGSCPISVTETNVRVGARHAVRFLHHRPKRIVLAPLRCRIAFAFLNSELIDQPVQISARHAKCPGAFRL